MSGSAVMRLPVVANGRICVVDLDPCVPTCPTCRGELSLPKKEKQDKDKFDDRRRY